MLHPLTLTAAGHALPPAHLYRALFVDCPTVSQYDSQYRPFDVETLDASYRRSRLSRSFASPLIPLNVPTYDAPFAVSPRHNEVVWVDLFVPESYRSDDVLLTTDQFFAVAFVA
jgi:hypothetical protein